MRNQYPGLVIEKLSSGKTRLRVRQAGNPSKRVLITVGINHPRFKQAYCEARESLDDLRMQKHELWGAAREARLRKELKKMVERSRSRKSKTHLPFDLTVDALSDMFHGQDRKCAVSFERFDFDIIGKKRPRAPSIDRIDCDKGYTMENVRLVTIILNTARSDNQDSEFYKMCAAVARNQDCYS